MRFRLVNFRQQWGTVIFAACVAAAYPGAAADGSAQQGTPIEFSTPKDAVTLPDVDLLGKKDDASAQGPNFSAGGSLTPTLGGAGAGATLPAPTPPYLIRGGGGRGGSALDVSTPDQMIRDMALKDILGLPDDSMVSEQQVTSLVNILSGRTATDQRDAADRSAHHDFSGLFGAGRAADGWGSHSQANSVDPFSGGRVGVGQPLSHLLGADPGSEALVSATRPASLSDMLGLSQSRNLDPLSQADPQQQDMAREAQLDQFRKLLGFQSATPGAPGPYPNVESQSPWLSTTPYAPLSAPDQNGVFAQGGAFAQGNAFAQGSVFASSGASGTASARGINSPYPTVSTAPTAPIPSSLDPVPYTPPPSRVRPMPRMDFQVPQRPF